MGILDTLAGGRPRAAGSLDRSNELVDVGRQTANDPGNTRLLEVLLSGGEITPERANAARAEARTASGNAFSNSLGVLERTRRARRPGSAGLSSGETRRVNLRRALGGVDASNRALRGLSRARDFSRVAGSGIRDFLLQEGTNLRRGAAAGETDREVGFQSEQAQASADRSASIGSLIGIAGGALG